MINFDPFGSDGSISSSDPDVTSKLSQRIEELQALQEQMKAGNKVFRKHFKTGYPNTPNSMDECIVELEAMGITRRPDHHSMNPNCPYVLFESWKLSNNNANINRLKKRLAEAQAISAKSDTIEEEIGDISVFVTDKNQLGILFPGIPCEQTRNTLKSNAWKWSRYQGAWVRKMTGNALWAYRHRVRPMLKQLQQNEEAA